MANGPNHINFVVRGTGDPTLIFVHGFACSLDDWEEQFRACRSSHSPSSRLSERHRIWLSVDCQSPQSRILR